MRDLTGELRSVRGARGPSVTSLLARVSGVSHLGPTQGRFFDPHSFALADHNGTQINAMNWQ